MEGDPEGDGVNNLLELAFNMDPKAQDRELLPFFTFSPGGNPEFNYRRLPQAETSGLAYTVEYSDNLAGPAGEWAVDRLQATVTETPKGMVTDVCVEDMSLDPQSTQLRLYRLTVLQGFPTN